MNIIVHDMEERVRGFLGRGMGYQFGVVVQRHESVVGVQQIKEFVYPTLFNYSNTDGDEERSVPGQMAFIDDLSHFCRVQRMKSELELEVNIKKEVRSLRKGVRVDISDLEEKADDLVIVDEVWLDGTQFLSLKHVHKVVPMMKDLEERGYMQIGAIEEVATNEEQIAVHRSGGRGGHEIRVFEVRHQNMRRKVSKSIAEHAVREHER